MDFFCRHYCISIIEFRLFEYRFLSRCLRLCCRCLFYCFLCCRNLFRCILSESCERTSLFLRLKEVRKVEPASARLYRLLFKRKYLFRFSCRCLRFFSRCFLSFLCCRRLFYCFLCRCFLFFNGFFYIYLCCRLFGFFSRCFFSFLCCRCLFLNCFCYLYFFCRYCLLFLFRNIERSNNRCIYIFIKRSKMELRNLFFLFLCRRCFRLKESRIKNLCIFERSLFRCCRCLWCRLSCRYLCSGSLLLLLLCLEDIDEAHRAAALSRRTHLSIQLFFINAAGSFPWGLDVRNGLLLRLVNYIAPVECRPLLEWRLDRLNCLWVRCFFSESESSRFFFNLRHFENFCYSCPACAAKSCSLWKLATAICTEHYITSAILRLVWLSISCSRAGLPPADVCISMCQNSHTKKCPIYIIIQ